MELRFSAKEEAGRRPFDVERKRDPSKLLHDAVNRRDFGVCAQCGFTSSRYMEIRARVAAPVSVDDYETVCPSCWQVENIDIAARQRSGELVWLPEIEQRELNREMPGIYAARLQAGSGVSDTIKHFLDTVVAKRRKLAFKKLGLADKDGLFKVFKDHPVGVPEALADLDPGLRLWPLDRMIKHYGDLEFNQYPQMMAFWRSKRGPLEGGSARSVLVVQDWLSRLEG